MNAPRRHSAALCTCNVYAVHTLLKVDWLPQDFAPRGISRDVVCRTAFRSQIENLGRLQAGIRLGSVGDPLQDRSGIIIILGVYMSESGVPSYRSLPSLLSCWPCPLRKYATHEPHGRQERHFLMMHLQSVLTCDSCIDI